MNAFAAVLLRDSRAAERGGLLSAARVLALAGCGLLAAASYAAFGPALGADIPVVFGGLVGGLMALSLIFAASFALGAFRAERQAGTLDLLLLAGLRPRTLAFARTVSSFLVLQSLALAALPALILFWYFRTPSPRDLVLHAIALTCWNAAVAAGAVVISAWSRQPATALAGCLTLLPAFAALSLTPGARLSWSAPGLVIRTAVGDGALAPSRGFLCIGLHLAAVAACVLLAEQGLRQQRQGELGTVSQAPTSRRRLSDRRPLTWLLHRCSPAARPTVQLIAMGVGLGLLAGCTLLAVGPDGGIRDLLEPRLLSVLGGSICLLSIGAALAAGATRIAAERERRTWETIASTARRSDALFGDLIGSTVLSCLVPFLLGAGLLFVAELGRGLSGTAAIAPAVAIAATLALAAVLGLAASACARSTAGALALGSLLALGIPALVGGGQVLGSGADFDTGGYFLAFLFVLVLPILVRGLGPFALLAVDSLGARTVAGKGPGRLITRPLCVLLPLAIATGALAGAGGRAWALSFGGAHAALTHVATLGEERRLLDPDLLLRGALWQALFALLMLNGLWRHRDLWLGRASR